MASWLGLLWQPSVSVALDPRRGRTASSGIYSGGSALKRSTTWRIVHSHFPFHISGKISIILISCKAVLTFPAQDCGSWQHQTPLLILTVPFVAIICARISQTSLYCLPFSDIFKSSAPALLPAWLPFSTGWNVTGKLSLPPGRFAPALAPESLLIVRLSSVLHCHNSGCLPRLRPGGLCLAHLQVLRVWQSPARSRHVLSLTHQKQVLFPVSVTVVLSSPVHIVYISPFQ